jgi:hypothetical protein
VSKNFSTIVVCDFEYEVAPGDLPNPLCMVAHVLNENLQHVRTIRLWRGEFGSAPPFDIGPDALFVAYSAWAEMTCFKVLGWNFPVHVFDQHTAYLAASNILLPYNPDEVRHKPPKDLESACPAYGLEQGWQGIDKHAIAKAIGDGTWRQHYTPEQVLDYCTEDGRMETLLLRAQIRGHGRFPPVNPARVMFWSEYSAKCIAPIQARGMPIDMARWNLVQENKAAVIGELLRRFDPSYGGFWAETVEMPNVKARTKKRKTFEIKWVKLPDYWIRQLEYSTHLGTYKLALRILREAYKQQHIGGEIVLSAAVTGLPGTTRRSAAKELVTLNLIQIQQDGTRATRVTKLRLEPLQPEDCK